MPPIVKLMIGSIIKNMKISFCSQVCNRFSQAIKTLIYNLNVLEGTIHQLVIIVYPCTDGTDKFIEKIKSNNLTVFYCEEKYDIVKAKNLSHNLASGDYLFNLDIDNFISNDLIYFILNNRSSVIHNWTGNSFDGTYGRIGMPKSKFIGVNGYPPYMENAGYHDNAILFNLSSYGAILRNKRVKIKPIKNNITVIFPRCEK